MADPTPAADASGAVTLRRTFLLPNPLIPPKWAAYRDGAGPWMPIEPMEKGGNEYQFVVSDSSKLIGFVVAGDLSTTSTFVVVTFLTVEDCLAGLELPLSRPIQIKSTWPGTISWSLAGLVAGEQAVLSLAGQLLDVTSQQGKKSGGGDWPEVGDLLVTVGPPDGPPTRMIVRRNVHLTPNITLPLIDLASAEAFALQVGQVDISKAPVADQADAAVYLTTANGSYTILSQSTPFSISPGGPIRFMALPISQEADGDLYQATYGSYSAAGVASVTSFSHAPTGQQLVIPSVPSGARVWNSGGPGEVRMTSEWPATTPGSVRFSDYLQSVGFTATTYAINVSPSYTAADDGPVTVPDLRDVAGWNSQWNLVPGVATNWSVGNTSSSSPDGVPRDGTSETTTTQTGTITP